MRLKMVGLAPPGYSAICGTDLKGTEQCDRWNQHLRVPVVGEEQRATFAVTVH